MGKVIVQRVICQWLPQTLSGGGGQNVEADRRCAALV